MQTLALRAAQGYTWVVAFNSRPEPRRRADFLRDFEQSLWDAVNSVAHWPEGDLF